jgi:hypothetical protein
MGAWPFPSQLRVRCCKAATTLCDVIFGPCYPTRVTGKQEGTDYFLFADDPGVGPDVKGVYHDLPRATLATRLCQGTRL